VSAPRLYLNHDADYDWLIAVEFGRINEGQGAGAWHGVNDRFGVLHDDDGRAIGFEVRGFSTFDAEAADLAEIWEPPLYDAPVLGLRAASAGEIVLAARALFGGSSSVNRGFFDAATVAEGEEALPLWLACLQAGDSLAHFGLGYTLHDLGRHREAYRHLRYYTEIAPELAWGWCWFGRAAASIGETAEAGAAFRRAIVLEEAGGDETDARALLAELEGRGKGR
jgi:tetratricopeptide (TPR) repeat protein